jgi:hypothetical protein
VMETKDWIAVAALLISLLSFLLATIALVWTSRHNAIMRQYASAGPETAILAQINQGRMRISEISLKMTDILKGRLPTALNADEKRHVQAIESNYHEAVETLLNSYELACGMYRDSKLDKERFRRQYGEEIRRLFVGTKAYTDRLHPPSSPYKALRAVHEEWFNPEK